MADPWEQDAIIEPHSFKDPAYDRYDEISAQKVGIPVDLLKSIRLKGERSNADQVSKSGARTVYQFIPSTRDAFLKKYGVDAYKDGQSASMAAALHLKESLDRHGGDASKAAAEYIGGPDVSQHGKQTDKYAKRVMKGAAPAPWEADPIVPEEQGVQPRHTDLSKIGLTPSPGQRQTQLAQPNQPSLLSYTGDQLKKGMFEDVLPLMTTVARVAVADPRMVNSLRQSKSISEAIGDLHRQNVEVFKNIGQVKDVAQPLNVAGQPSKAAEYAGTIARFAGAGGPFSARAVALSSAKALAATVETLGTISSGMLSAEAKDWAGAWHKELGLTKEQAEAWGSTLGALGGPGLIAAIGKKFQQMGNLAMVQDLTNRFGKAKDAIVAKMGTPGMQEAAKARVASRGAGEVSQKIQEEIKLHPGSAAALQEEMALRQQIPGFQSNIARATEAPALLGQQQSMMSTSPEHLAMGAEEESRLRSAVTGFQEAKFPAGKVSVPEQAKSTFEKQADSVQQRLNHVDNKLRQMSASGKRLDMTAAGGEAKNLLEQQLKLQQEKSALNYSAWYEEGRKLNYRPSTRDIYSSTAGVAGSDATKWVDKSPIIHKILTDYAPKKVKGLIVGESGKPLISGTEIPTIPLKEWHSLYKRLGREIGKAQAENTPQARALLETLRPIQHSLYGMIEKDMAGKGRLESLFRDANAFHQKNVVENFQKGVVGKVRDLNKFGETTPPSKVIAKVWATPEGVEQYFNAMGTHPQARKVYEDGVVDLFMNKVAKDGVIDPAKARDFLAKNARKLDLTPNVRQNLINRTQATETVLARRDAIVRQQKEMDKGILAQTFRSEQPDLVIGKAMNNPADMRQLVAAVKNNPEATKSLAREVSTNISKMRDPHTYLAENENTLKPLMDQLGKDHWNNLQTITKAQRKIGLVTTPTTVTPPGAKGFIKELTGVEAQSFLTRVLGLGNIKGSEAYRTLFLGSKFAFKISAEAQQKALEATFFNPDVASVLAGMQKNGITQKAINEFKNHLLAHGVRILTTAPGLAQERQDVERRRTKLESEQ